VVQLIVFVLHRHGDFVLKDWPVVPSPAFPFSLIWRNRCCTVVSYAVSWSSSHNCCFL